MDCILKAKFECLGAVLLDDDCLVLKQINGLILQKVRDDLVSFTEFMPFEVESSSIQLRLHLDKLFIFYDSTSFAVLDAFTGSPLVTSKLQSKKPFDLTSLGFFEDCLVIATRTHNSLFITPWNPESSSKALKMKLPAKVTVDVIVVKPGTKLFALGCSDGQIRVWNAETGEEGLPVIDTGVDSAIDKRLVTAALKKNKYPAIKTLDFSSSGDRLLVGDARGAIMVWRTEVLFND